MPEPHDRASARSAKDLPSLIAQSVTTLQEVDRRLQVIRADLAALMATAAGQGMHPGGPGFPAPGLGGPGAPYGAPFGGPFGQPFAPPFAPPFAGPFGPQPFGAQPFGVQPFGGPLAAAQGPFGGQGPVGQGQGTPPGAPGLGSGPAPGMGMAPPSVKDLERMQPVPRAPTVTLADVGNEYVLEFELPGVKKEDLDIRVTERTVALSATSRPELREGTVLLLERPPVAYQRVLPLPTEVQTAQSKASVKDGILTLRVSKKSPTEGAHRIDVAYG